MWTGSHWGFAQPTAAFPGGESPRDLGELLGTRFPHSTVLMCSGHGLPWFVGTGPRPKELGLVTVLCRQWPVALIPVAWQVQATHLHLGERTVLYARNLSHIWDWWGWHQGGNGVREKAFLLSQGLGRPPGCACVAVLGILPSSGGHLSAGLPACRLLQVRGNRPSAPTPPAPAALLRLLKQQ